ncbi:NAD(P)/FAD-dependent oxidoreductase [Microbacterium sp. No. 7]|uniref:NAD(P)/FAD-dependent oxidoreductase n=1 Tax=Microbacterium sp. No. 7 TaxID=1714373 RepID=UPI0006CFAF10|nr:FAD-dependent oxidoreductase [Microbacterium sp. No. 7]ALJ18455.1 hypothetical protein AOA12_00395 [Microbacterium sp. No. 7]
MTIPDAYDLLVVGGGHAGVAVVGQLRKSGYAGTIGVIEGQDELPYERPPLSKGLLLGDVTEEELRLRRADYWQSGVADLHLGVTVTSVDPRAHRVTIGDGSTVGYGRLVWATGASARALPLPGADSENVVAVRTLADARRLERLAATAATAVLIGGGYIGLETAATLAKLGTRVTVVEAQSRLLARVSGPAVARRLAELHAGHGVRVVVDAQVSGLRTAGSRVTSVVLGDGDVLDADLVVVGIGVEPRIAQLVEAGAATAGGVLVDSRCRTGLDGVYAIGDVAAQECGYAGGARLRIESVPNATEQAKCVAADVVGGAEIARGVPWFWSQQYDVRLQTAGILAGFDQEVVREPGADDAYVVGYFREGLLVAADCLNAPRDFNVVKTLLGRRLAVTPERFSAAPALADLLSHEHAAATM